MDLSKPRYDITLSFSVGSLNATLLAEEMVDLANRHMGEGDCITELSMKPTEYDCCDCDNCMPIITEEK